MGHTETAASRWRSVMGLAGLLFPQFAAVWPAGSRPDRGTLAGAAEPEPARSAGRGSNGFRASGPSRCGPAEGRVVADRGAL